MACVVAPSTACRASAFGNNNARAALARLRAGPWPQHRRGDLRPADPCKWVGFRAQAEGSIFGLDATQWAVATRAFTFSISGNRLSIRSNPAAAADEPVSHTQTSRRVKLLRRRSLSQSPPLSWGRRVLWLSGSCVVDQPDCRRPSAFWNREPEKPSPLNSSLGAS